MPSEITQNTNPPKRIALLGATGSIGTQAIEVIQAFPERFSLHSLTAYHNADRLTKQINTLSPRHAWIEDSHLSQLKSNLHHSASTQCHSGQHALCDLASDPEVDIVIVGIVGMAGLAPTLAALKAGKKVLTANKETFVAGGHLVAPYRSQIIPVDSEHSALFQCLDGHPPSDVQRLILTASGGPFYALPTEDMVDITKASALKHPNWVMGQKITIDSATMMNKGLEVIEAHWLFNQSYDNIDIWVHPQSIVHSGVEWIDGTVTTQWGTPDMRLPLQYALGYPHRLPCPHPVKQRLTLNPNTQTLGPLEFQAPDTKKFPAIPLAYAAGRLGNGACCVLNAANEVAVARFLNHELHYLEIINCIETTLSAYTNLQHAQHTSPDLATLTDLDHQARLWATSYQPTFAAMI